MPAATRPTRPTRRSARGRTGHNEVVLVVYDPEEDHYEQLLKTFWESHDPTQGMRQGNDVGTQYRSGIYAFTPAQRKAAEASKAMYEQGAEGAAATAPITTEIVDAPPFYFAEDYHQQYLAKNPMRLLRPRRHRRELPDRHRRAGCAVCAGLTAQRASRRFRLTRGRAVPRGRAFFCCGAAHPVELDATQGRGVRHAQSRARHRELLFQSRWVLAPFYLGLALCLLLLLFHFCQPAFRIRAQVPVRDRSRRHPWRARPDRPHVYRPTWS